MGENNTLTALKACGVKSCVIYIEVTMDTAMHTDDLLLVVVHSEKRGPKTESPGTLNKSLQ